MTSHALTPERPARRRVAYATLAAGALLVPTMLLGSASSEAPATAKVVEGVVVDCVTSSGDFVTLNGYCTIEHDLGVKPTSVVASGVAPIAGPDIPMSILTDSYTATTFRIRAFDQASAGMKGKHIWLSYTAVADPASPPSSTTPTTSPPITLEPDPTTPPVTTEPPVTTTPPTTTPPPTTDPPPAGGPFVQPGTQGYQGSAEDLTVYSAANGATPNIDCSWNQTYKFLDCDGQNLTLDHAYVQGGIYWRGCGNLLITDSIVDWQPSLTWHSIYAQCENALPDTVLEVHNSSLRTGPPSDPASPASSPASGGGTDDPPLKTHSNRPMIVSNSLLTGFPQGLHPTGGSVISNNEIYVRQGVGCAGPCDHHLDGLFSQGGNNITYQGNYIVVPTNSEATAAVFFQGPASSGHVIDGNYLQGGAYTLRNQTATGVVVTNNTFGGSVWGDVSDENGTYSVWQGNVHPDGTVVTSGQ